MGALPNTHQRYHPVPHGSSCLACRIGVGFAKDASALRVPEFDDAAPDLGEDRGGGVTRVGAAIFMVGVLGAGEDGGVL